MAQRAIRRGGVSVAGAVVRAPATPVPDGAEVRLDGVAVAPPGHRYLMLYKPPGVVCVRGDGAHRSVFDLLRDELRSERLHVAGRLDADVTGLVLITDDGAWSHRVMAPRHKQPKTYLARLAEPLSAAAAAALSTGVLLQGEPRPTRPAEIEVLDDRHARLTVREGRYHQVKRMFAAVGNRVLALHRERIGALGLDPDLPAGAYRHLTETEVAAAVAAAPDSRNQ